MQSLDDVLNGSDEAQEAVTDEAQEQDSQTESQTDADTGPKGEQEQSEEKEVKRETPERETDEKDWTFAAYRDEKRKRQELEKELESLRKPKEAEKAPDVLNDPDGFQQYQQSQVDQKITDVKAQMSQFYAEKEHGKEKVQNAFNKFSEMVKESPELYNKVIGEISPYHAIVEIVDKAEKFDQMQNIDEYEAKLRAKVEQELRAEFEKQYSGKQAKKSSVTPSLNSLAQSGADKATASEALGDILGR